MTTSYKETLDFLFKSLPMYQRQGKAAYKANLNNTIQLDKALLHPHRKFKSIHIAGTNGKGSVSHMLASIMQESGLKTGLYTSPHLLDFRERIRINGIKIPEEKVVEFIKKIRTIIKEIQPSFFEMTVAMAFDYFAQENVDIAIIETGLGGRLDSTNIINPEISIITNISMDHTQFLGDTIEKIAIEKAGIIKENNSIIAGQNLPEALECIKTIAKEKNAKFFNACDTRKFTFQTINSDSTSIFHYKNKYDSESWESDLHGSYQSENIQTTLCAIDLLKENGWDISNEHLSLGLKKTTINTCLRGRWEILASNPRIICDTGHNVAGVKMISKQLQQLAHKELHIIWGMVNDKSIEDILLLLPADAKYYFSEPSISRKMPSEKLFSFAKKHKMDADIYPSIQSAIKEAQKRAKPEDTIFIGGSTFVVAETLPLFQ